MVSSTPAGRRPAPSTQSTSLWHGAATDGRALVWAADSDDCNKRIGAGFFGDD
jgi:hypothetical protein